MSITIARNRIKRILREKSSPDIWRRDESAKPRDVHNSDAAAESRAVTPMITVTDIRSKVNMDFVKDMKWWRSQSPTRTQTRRLHSGSLRQRQERRSRELATPAGAPRPKTMERKTFRNFKRVE